MPIACPACSMQDALLQPQHSFYCPHLVLQQKLYCPGLPAALSAQAKRQKRVLEEDEYDLDDDFIDDQDADDEVEVSDQEGEGQFYVYQVIQRRPGWDSCAAWPMPVSAVALWSILFQMQGLQNLDLLAAGQSCSLLSRLCEQGALEKPAKPTPPEPQPQPKKRRRKPPAKPAKPDAAAQVCTGIRCCAPGMSVQQGYQRMHTGGQTLRLEAWATASWCAGAAWRR